MKLVFEIELRAEGLRPVVFHPEIRPDDLDELLLSRVRSCGGAGAGRWGFEELPTALGWRAVTVETDLIVAARYEFFHFAAAVVIVAERAEDLEAGRAAIREFLASARPDFSDELPSLSDLCK